MKLPYDMLQFIANILARYIITMIESPYYLVSGAYDNLIWSSLYPAYMYLHLLIPFRYARSYRSSHDAHLWIEPVNVSGRALVVLPG